MPKRGCKGSWIATPSAVADHVKALKAEEWPRFVWYMARALYAQAVWTRMTSNSVKVDGQMTERRLLVTRLKERTGSADAVETHW